MAKRKWAIFSLLLLLPFSFAKALEVAHPIEEGIAEEHSHLCKSVWDQTFERAGDDHPLHLCPHSKVTVVATFLEPLSAERHQVQTVPAGTTSLGVNTFTGQRDRAPPFAAQL